MLNGIHSRITPEMAETLYYPVTLSDLQNALDEMASGKSPGLDGIAMKLYKCMWLTFGEEYLQMLQDSIARETLS